MSQRTKRAIYFITDGKLFFTGLKHQGRGKYSAMVTKNPLIARTYRRKTALKLINLYLNNRWRHVNNRDVINGLESIDFTIEVGDVSLKTVKIDIYRSFGSKIIMPTSLDLINKEIKGFFATHD